MKINRVSTAAKISLKPTAKVLVTKLVSNPNVAIAFNIVIMWGGDLAMEEKIINMFTKKQFIQKSNCNQY